MKSLTTRVMHCCYKSQCYLKILSPDLTFPPRELEAILNNLQQCANSRNFSLHKLKCKSLCTQLHILQDICEKSSLRSSHGTKRSENSLFSAYPYYIHQWYYWNSHPSGNFSLTLCCSQKTFAFEKSLSLGISNNFLTGGQCIIILSDGYKLHFGNGFFFYHKPELHALLSPEVINVSISRPWI